MGELTKFYYGCSIQLIVCALPGIFFPKLTLILLFKFPSYSTVECLLVQLFCMLLFAFSYLYYKMATGADDLAGRKALITGKIGIFFIILVGYFLDDSMTILALLTGITDAALAGYALYVTLSTDYSEIN